ncbi:MAG: redoxin domain-containing protein [Candidatus Zixiibacteriota bacterium]|nr:MAG: redoxin domain-containing protein [candidate division Zixibacteria bacterium]
MEESSGCARPTGKVLGQKDDSTPAVYEETKEEKTMAVRVGQKAPDFEAPAYHNGGFKKVKLSESLGQWVLLCFYPGDFTFV